jgi:hypothetical protein
MSVQEIRWGSWTELICLRIKATLWLHKMRGISWLAEERLSSQEGLCSKELDIIYKDLVCTAQRI